MLPFTQHNGLVVTMDRADVDTDQIIPKQFLKRIERTGFGQFLFFDWRRWSIERSPYHREWRIAVSCGRPKLAPNADQTQRCERANGAGLHYFVMQIMSGRPYAPCRPHCSD